MSTIALAVSLVLAVVFAVAAVTKLADRTGTRRAVAAFGAPERSAGAFALILPLAELTVAGLLLWPGTAVYGAIGALVLLAIFSVAIAASLARGRAPDCHCFGQLHSAPASWKTLARNGVLAGLAVVSLVGNLTDEQTSAFAWLGDLEGAELLALIVAAAAIGIIVVGGAAFLTLMRSYGQVLTRLDRVEAALASAGYELEDEAMPEFGLAPGTPAPAFSANALSGDPASLATFLETGLPAVLLFTSPHCGPCSTLMPTVAAWQRDYAEAVSIVLVSDGTAVEVGAEAEEHELANVLLDDGHATYEAYEANGTPSAVVIAPDGTIGSWVAVGSEWIERLVEHAAAADGDAVEGLPVGAEVPAVELPSLEGEAVSLSSLRGDDALLLFWNPDCGFCRSMHDDLLAWEASTNGDAPRLVVVSSGDAESTRAEGFASLVLLDESFEAGSAFGANGTPMAVLVDADGRIASNVVAGAEAVIELANGR
jgi:thiol-disulfide isomerase/thioredoxin